MYTIKNSVSETGIGMFSGEPIKLTISPTDQEGIWFKNKYAHTQKLMPDNIYVANNNTSIQFKDGTKIGVVEHLLSSIYAHGITDIIIEVDGDEIPLFDGGSIGYTMLIDEMKLVKKEKTKIAYLTKKVRVQEGKYYVQASPSNKLKFDSTIEFENTPIGKQRFKYNFSRDSYRQEIAPARTFGIVDDLQLAKQYYKGSNLKNTLIVQNGQLLNEQKIENEFVRHKILDSIGDIRAFEYPLIMNYKSFGSSHKLNNMLLKEIIAQNAYELVEVVQAYSILDYENEKIKSKIFG